MSEANIQREIMLRLSRLGCRLFRVNVGQAWTGNSITKATKKDQHFVLQPGDIVIRKAHPLKTGVPKGYSDLTGWTPLEITADLIGQKVLVFTAIEVKSPNGKPTAEQLNFVNVVESSGGYAGIARGIPDAEKIVHMIDLDQD